MLFTVSEGGGRGGGIVAIHFAGKMGDVGEMRKYEGWGWFVWVEIEIFMTDANGEVCRRRLPATPPFLSKYDRL